ncbi:uncharacterized protein LOC131438066 [Malaya genurostris]|uniref:uncharacterized protein LOC131438066 n=1 Tax=Malaya genurostris TaxID=325434 RepID=UPI0026F3DFC3|nr:uncharacterized protein LOC131438066 [Malaya genurostris]
MIRPGHRHEPWNAFRDHELSDSPVYSWVQWSVTSGVPPATAVQAGTDTDGSPIFVGRATHYGTTLPAKVIPIRRVAYVSYDGIEIFKPNVEVLCGLGFTWVPSGRGHIPKGAVLCGSMASGEPIYIGRAHHDGSVTPGKIIPKHGSVYIPYGGYEHAHPEYDVLVDARKSQKQSVGGKWVSAESKGPVPIGALVAGNDSDGTQIYLGRVYRHGLVLPAKVIPRKQMCHVGDEGLEFEMTEYEALCHANVAWVPFRGVYPINAIECGLDRNGEKLYFGRGHYNGSLTPGKILECSKILKIPFNFKEIPLREFDILVDNSDPKNQCSQTLNWQPCTNKSPIAGKALLVGYDSDQSPIYLGRVKFEGNQLPAKVIPRKGLCRTGYRGKEYDMTSYEALCNARVTWVPFRGVIPSRAIVCGRTQWGETVYVGRGSYKGSLTPGRILENEKVLKIPYEWNEIAIRDAEILVEI